MNAAVSIASHTSPVWGRPILVLLMTIAICTTTSAQQPPPPNPPPDTLPITDITGFSSKAVKSLAHFAGMLETEKSLDTDANGDGIPDVVGDVRQLLGPLEYVQFANIVLTMFDTLVPAQTVDQFSLLRAHLNAQTEGLGWQIAQTALDQDLALATSAVVQSRVAIETQMRITADGDPMNNSSAAVERAMLDSAFHRAFAPLPDGLRAAVGDPDHPHNWQYDWRLGVPVLMKLIPMRMIVLSAFDPAWMKNGLFKEELLRYRNALIQHYSRMVSGVRCGEEPPGGESNFGEFVCVDVHTGLHSYASWVGSPNAPTHEPDSNLNRIEMARLEVFRQMPLFQMRAMIDSLYALTQGGMIFPSWGGYASHCANLTANSANPEVEEFYRVNFCNRVEELGQGVNAGPIYQYSGGQCLDVPNNDAFEGAALWTYECTNPFEARNDAQLFAHDPTSGEIKHVASGLCVDVRDGDIERKSVVQLWGCNGTDAQRWTWDPENRVLQNALNTVLDVKWGAVGNETPVWTWYRTEGEAQRWY
jgi:Ricin-type beta-trefoil lectin domain